jgi:hypothetical protein
VHHPFLFCAGSAPAQKYELDILHGFDVPHGEEYVLHEEEHVEVNGTLTHRDPGDPYIGEPYVGSLPLECIEKCVADPSCHGACCCSLAKGLERKGPFLSRAILRAPTPP